MENTDTQAISEIENVMTDMSTDADISAQYLTFNLDGEAFATEIAKVREVLEYAQITPVPRSPEYMLGVINLRGNVVPIVDLRLQFDMETAEVDVNTCIIIIEIEIEGTATVLGVLADQVQEVIELRPEQLELVPSLGTRVKNEFIHAMGKIDDRFIIVLDMQHVFSAIQLEKVTSSAGLSANQEGKGNADTA